MQSIPTFHKAGSTASASRVSSSKIDFRGSASNTSSRKTFSRIPTATRRVSSSTDSSFTERSSLSTIRSLKGKQRAQENLTNDSELIQEIKTLEGYKAKAISAEKQTTSLVKENNNLQYEVETLRILLTPLEDEIGSLRHSLGESEIRLGEQERQQANEQARADGLASELEATKAKNDRFITNMRHAAEQLEASQAERIELTQQLEAERAARNADSEFLQSQQQEMQEQLTAKQKLESELQELRPAHQREQRQKLEVEQLYTEILDERRILQMRCDDLDGLVESMCRFGETLQEIKKRQQDINTQIATLNGSVEVEREQLRRDHLEVLAQYRSHIDNIGELEVNYIDRINVLEGHIVTLQELIQGNNHSHETEFTREASLIDRLEGLIENNNRCKDDTLDELRPELAEATTAMNLFCSQQSPQAERQELSPPSSSIIALSSSQATDKRG
ncbi:uncharacterized protein BDV14DRAFT_12938 [Aspergillus stella-maris]|uniref:uncharacterized protein n=1 Tax=Aspergillus stella-maris TaxID=1810926 RepID=UPI003CCD196B